VGDAEIVGVLGHNGMGKSTVLKAAMGLITPTAGAVMFEGRDMTSLPPHTRAHAGIGYVPQGRGILATLTAEENLRLAYIGREGKRGESDALEHVLTVLPRLKRLLDRKGGLLSGGEQQLLALARALMPKPRLLLLDEPTEGIQPNIVEEMATTLQGLRSQHNMSVLVVEQNLDFVLDCAERLLVLERGQIVSEAKGDLLRDPQSLTAFVEME
jgi:ABC-type branched-subunit amino acid transport system ATPase component